MTNAHLAARIRARAFDECASSVPPSLLACALGPVVAELRDRAEDAAASRNPLRRLFFKMGYAYEGASA